MRLMLMQKAGRLLNMHPGNAVCQSQVDSYNQLAGRAAVLFSFNLGKRGATKWSDGFMSPQAFLNSWTQVQFWLLWASDSHVISKLRTISPQFKRKWFYCIYTHLSCSLRFHPSSHVCIGYFCCSAWCLLPTSTIRSNFLCTCRSRKREHLRHILKRGNRQTQLHSIWPSYH